MEKIEDLQRRSYLFALLWSGACPQRLACFCSGFLWAFKIRSLDPLTGLISRSRLISIALSLAISLPAEGLVGLQTTQAIREGQRPFCLGMCSAGKPTLTWKQTHRPAHALSHSRLSSQPDLCSQSSSLCAVGLVFTPHSLPFSVSVCLLTDTTLPSFDSPDIYAPFCPCFFISQTLFTFYLVLE